MGLDVAYQHICATRAHVAGSLEHGVGLAYTGGSVRAWRGLPRPGRERAVGQGRAVVRPLANAFVHFTPSSAKFNSNTLTRGSPSIPSHRRWVCAATSLRTAPGRMLRARATRAI